MIDLRGKTILVTGSSRGIGRSIAEVCYEAGASIILHYRQSAGLASSIAADFDPERCLAVQAEISDLDQVKRLWERAIAWKGKVDVVVNNASIRLDLELNEPDAAWDAAWQKVLGVNLVGPAHLCRLAIRHFGAVGGGSIINIASRPAFRGDTVTCPFDGAAKGGLVSLTRQIARHYGDINVKAFVVAPGIIETDQAAEFFAASGDAEKWRTEIPAGRFGYPKEIANVVAFLASGLADYATGSTIDVNGASYVH